jgi:hypothetical protein
MAKKVQQVHRTTPQSTTKSVAPKVPAIQQARILQLAAAGKSLREIAKEQHRDRRTITKIVNQPEMHNVLDAVKNRLIQLAHNAADSVAFAIDNEVDAKVALRLLESFGVLSSGRPGKGIEELESQGKRTPDEAYDAMVKEQIMKLTEVAMVRGKAFGNAMPELDDLDSEYAEVITGKS